MKFINRKIKWNILLVVFSLILVSSVFADDIKFIQVGMFQNFFSSTGCEIEIARDQGQQDGFVYPGLFEDQDMQAQKALWLGVKNYNDPITNNTYAHKVVHVGPRSVDEKSEFMPQEFKLYAKFNHPAVYVDNTPGTDLFYRDKVDVVDETMNADRMLYNVVNTSIGVEMTRKVYAYGQENHDAYLIYDYVLKNNGVYDSDGNKHSATLEDLIMFLQYRWAPTKYACDQAHAWTPQSINWGHATVNEILHPKYGDDYSAIYAWAGLHSKYNDINNIGLPNTGDGDLPADGFLGGSQFPGAVVIHVDKSSSDPTNDPNGLSKYFYFGSDASITKNNDQFNAAAMDVEYLQCMNQDIPELDMTHASALNYPHNSGWQDAPFTETGYPDLLNLNELQSAGGGGMSAGMGFGPYTLAPGDSVRIVIAECAGTISWAKRIEVGEKWYNEIKPYTLPDNSTTEDKDEYKDAWVFTGRDSLLQAFDRAKEAYDNEYVIPQPPPPPSSFTVTSGGDRIVLDWTNNAETDPHFGGYKIYRVMHDPDTTFSLLYECGEGTGNSIINKYEDMSPVRGFNYYYYITSFDDGTQNLVKPGVPLESSLFWTRTIEPANLKRMPGKALEDIRVVPNPYHINASQLQFGMSGANRLMFYELPPICTIKIYTERGDMIKTIKHTDGSGDEEWTQITSSTQMIVSGVYIAHIETPDGETAFRKFIIIR